MPRKGDLKSGVERYENGRIKYEQDYKAQYEKYKEARVLIGVKVEPEIAEKFNVKLGIDGTTKNAKIKEWIMDYLSGNLE